MSRIPRRVGLPLTGLPLLVLALPACGGDGASSSLPYLSSDSAGVEIVEVNWTAAPERWTVRPEPDLVLGGGVGPFPDLELFGVADARALDEGVVVIGEAGSRQLLRVDLETGEVDRWGSPGEGPGEFGTMQRIFHLGEGEVGVLDMQRRRLIRFGPGGDLLGEDPLPQPVEGQAPPTLRKVTLPGERPRFVASHVTGLPSQRTEGLHRGIGPVTHFDRPADTIAVIRGNTTFVSDAGVGVVVHGATTLLTGGPEGLWIGDTDVSEVELRDLAGAILRVVRWEPPSPREVTEADRDAFWDRIAAEAPEAEREMVPMLRRMVPLADRLPAFGALLTDPAGRLWIGEYVSMEHQMLEAAPPAQEWLVVDFQAQEAVRLRTPEGLRVVQVSDSILLAVHMDELGVETVRRYRIERGG